MSTDACFVYLLRRGQRPAGAAGDPRRPLRRSRPPPADGPRRRHHRRRSGAREPIAIDRAAHLDPRFRSFPNLPEDEYESILAVPVLARDKLAGALNVRTRDAARLRRDEIALLTAIAGQVGQAIENAKLYERSLRRVAELEALADIGATVSSSLYLDEARARDLRAHAAGAGGRRCALVLASDDGLRVAHRTGQLVPDAQLLELAAAGAAGRRDGRRAAAGVEGADDRRAGRAGAAPAGLVARGAVASGDGRARRRRGGRERAHGAARAAGPGDPPPGQEQPADGGLAAAPADGRGRRPARRQGPAGVGQPGAVDRGRARPADLDRRRRPGLRGADRPPAGDARPGSGRARGSARGSTR